MAPLQTLYAAPSNFRTYKIQIAAQYSGKKVELAKDVQLGKSRQSAAFLAKFPLGKVRIT